MEIRVSHIEEKVKTTGEFLTTLLIDKVEEDTILLTVQQTADMLNVSRPTVYALINNGNIASCKIGKARRITKESVTQYIQSIVTTTSTITNDE